jgi:hypothetical protein
MSTRLVQDPKRSIELCGLRPHCCLIRLQLSSGVSRTTHALSPTHCAQRLPRDSDSRCRHRRWVARSAMDYSRPRGAFPSAATLRPPASRTTAPHPRRVELLHRDHRLTGGRDGSPNGRARVHLAGLGLARWRCGASAGRARVRTSPALAAHGAGRFVVSAAHCRSAGWCLLALAGRCSRDRQLLRRGGPRLYRRCRTRLGAGTLFDVHRSRHSSRCACHSASSIARLEPSRLAANERCSWQRNLHHFRGHFHLTTEVACHELAHAKCTAIPTSLSSPRFA